MRRESNTRVGFHEFWLIRAKELGPRLAIRAPGNVLPSVTICKLECQSIGAKAFTEYYFTADVWHSYLEIATLACHALIESSPNSVIKEMEHGQAAEDMCA